MPLPKCVRIEYADKRSAEALLEDGWREVEVLETWRRKAKPVDADRLKGQAEIRRAEKRDMNALIWIAQTSFVHDRLHSDNEICSAEADKAKGEWVRRAFSGDADRIFVAEYDDRVVGFVICKVIKGYSVIDLIAVDRRYREHGIGSQLLVYAIHHYGLDMEAGTQERNKAGKELYKSLGFVCKGKRRTFHKN